MGGAAGLGSCDACRRESTRRPTSPGVAAPAALLPMARETPARLVVTRFLLAGAALAFVLARDQPGRGQHAADRGVDVLQVVGRSVLHQALRLSREGFQRVAFGFLAFGNQFRQAALQALQFGVHVLTRFHAASRCSSLGCRTSSKMSCFASRYTTDLRYS